MRGLRLTPVIFKFPTPCLDWSAGPCRFCPLPWLERREGSRRQFNLSFPSPECLWDGRNIKVRIPSAPLYRDSSRTLVYSTKILVPALKNAEYTPDQTTHRCGLYGGWLRALLKFMLLPPSCYYFFGLTNSRFFFSGSFKMTDWEGYKFPLVWGTRDLYCQEIF
jgi:hypothetical protein